VQRAGSQRRVSAARLAAQQARLDPAFLFSSLDLVQGLYERDPASAEATLQNLIDYLRTALPVLESDGSTVEREVQLARLYLEILRARLGSRLTIAIDVQVDVEHAAFPPMIAVPLVEQVVREGLEPVPHGGRLQIRAARRGDSLELTVDHAGIALDPTDVGFAVLRERLAQHYGADASLVILSAAGGGLARIVVPCDVPSR
jgi:LytS/YehU family sensor histidine kinase